MREWILPTWALVPVVGVLGLALAWTCYQLCRLAIELRPRKRERISREAIDAHVRRHPTAGGPYFIERRR